MSSVAKNSNDSFPAHNWVWGQTAADANTALSSRGTAVFRGIRVGDIATDGPVLALVRKEGDDAAGEKVTGLALAGETFPIDFHRVGTDTTCQDLTVYE